MLVSQPLPFTAIWEIPVPENISFMLVTLEVFHPDTSSFVTVSQPANIRIISVMLLVSHLDTSRTFSFAQFMNMP